MYILDYIPEVILCIYLTILDIYQRLYYVYNPILIYSENILIQINVLCEIK